MRDEEIAALLEKTSRTFALAIPLLDAPLARRVGLAYLLFRIADTLEDAELWDRDQRLVALRSFEQWIGGGRGEWKHAPPPTKDVACLELLDRADAVLAEVPDTERGHVKRTAHGMAQFVARQDERGRIQLTDLEDLRAYCYVVAGIVGELLTELFGFAPALWNDGKLFGEGLQLVNILKDAPSDAEQGRMYLPASVPRAEVMTVAREDLRAAERYIDELAARGASRGTIAFCTLPQRLAVATLDRLDEGKPKLSREEAMGIFANVTSSSSR
jgi:farnesyl-diphosphate farnesyltransferase